MLGEQFVKNYHLPLEEQLLSSTRLRYGVKIPAPELELVFLSLRALLKYRDRNVIKDLFGIRTPGLPPRIRRELRWLLAQTSTEQVERAVQALPGVPGELVLQFLHHLESSRRGGGTLFRLRTRLRRALRPWQRYSRPRAVLQYYGELWRRSHFFGRRAPARKMTVAGRAPTVAFVGADGAGKSTICSLLHDWLSWKLDVRLYYMGSKQPPWSSRLSYLLFRTARRSQRASEQLFGQKSFPSRWLDNLRKSLFYVYHLSNGYVRYRRYRESRKQAARGSLVIYDRFPLAAKLDGPKIEAIAGDDRRGLADVLSRREKAVYRKIDDPDYFFLLAVNPDVSLQRKPDHDRAAIEQKHRVLQKMAKQESDGMKLIEIDASRPLESVVAELKSRLWRLL